MLGVEAIVVGTVADMGNSVDLRARLVDVEKGAAITAAQIDVVKDPTITKIISNARRPAIYGKAISKPTKEGEAVSVELLKVTVRNLTIEIINCKKSGKDVTCDLIITNNDPDRELCIWWSGYQKYINRIFDEFGNEYWADSVKLANKTAKFGNPSHSRRSLNHLFVSGIPIKISFTFLGEIFLSKANSISLFEFWLNEGDKNFKIQFRDIPITGQGL